MALILVVFQSHFIVNNILEGLIWFFIPTSLVICNDIFAYICGFFWGRNQLITLSPKKTIEGFVGGWICTMIFGLLVSNSQHFFQKTTCDLHFFIKWSTLLMRFDYMICPVKVSGERKNKRAAYLYLI